MSKVIESITLGYCEGSSDKVYHASVEDSGSGYVVNFSYGRRGGTMNVGTKTNTPTTIHEALTIYNKIVREKKAKGYTEISSSSSPKMSAPATTSKAEPVPVGDRVLPQLLNPVDESELERLFMDDNWVMQPKMDGKRILVHRTSGRSFATNRTGIECGVPTSILEQVEEMADEVILDGELIGDQYHVFDLLTLGGTDMRDNSYHFRLTKLINLFAGKPSRHDNCIQYVPSWSTSFLKREAFAMIKKEKGEGVVFKRKMSAYKSGRPASGGNQLKFKFVATASVVVYRHNKGKRSVAMSVFYKAGGGAATDIGNVTIGGAIPIPPEGSVIEVQYLYAYKDGSLFQPVYLGQRDDISPTDCTIDQLKYKAEPALTE